MRTVNNGTASAPFPEGLEYIPTGQYLWRNPIWVNLLGDPTLRAFPLASATGLSATLTQEGTHLSWQASHDPDVLGYRLYKAGSSVSDLKVLPGAETVQGLEWHDPDGQDGDIYMLRAYGRKEVYAGAFFTYGQGVFIRVGQQVVQAPNVQVDTQGPGIKALPVQFSAPQGQLIYSFIDGAKTGQMRFEEGGWRYTPPTGFSGPVALRYGVSGPFGTAEGVLTLNIQP